MKKHSQQLIATITVISGIVLIMMAFIVPPRGEISPTVLTAYGETLTFAGAIIGIDYKYKK